MAFSSRTARTKKLWPMMWTITSTGCSLCCWPVPWLVAPGWPVRPMRRKSWTWGQTPPSSWTYRWIWFTSITSEPSAASQRCPWPNACSGSRHATWMSHWQRRSSAVDGDASPWTGCWILAMIWPMSEDSNRSVNWSSSLRPLTAPPREDGRPAPAPLRSEVYPDGLPTLSGRYAQRIDTDNKACNYVLEEIQKLRDRGGGSVRENPARSLHWWTSTEVAMSESVQWTDTSHAACTLGGARCKHQALRHNLEEIQQWPPANCHHVYDP